MEAPAEAALERVADRAGMRIDDMEEAVSPVAEGQESGEFFRYEVTTPVSVKRGESALVPIIGTEIAYSKELLYNGTKLPHHPVASLRFANGTGLTLERGPVTIIEDGDYRGEAVVPFTRADTEVYLAYAVELGVRVVERVELRTEMAGLNIQTKYLIINEYQVRSVAYTLDNATERDLTVTLEAPIRTGYELFETPLPDVETIAGRRWRVPVPAHGSAEFVRRERRLTRRHEEVRNLSYQRLQRYMEDRWLDQATFDLLAGLLDNLAFIENAHAEQEEISAERKSIYDRQGQLRKNLTTLKPAGEEGPLRMRMLRQLEASEDRLEEIDARLAELDEQIAQAEEQVEQTLAALGGEEAG
jgi:hypothetical protein